MNSREILNSLNNLGKDAIKITCEFAEGAIEGYLQGWLTGVVPLATLMGTVYVGSLVSFPVN